MKYICSIVAAGCLSLLIGCAAEQDEQAKISDEANDIEPVMLSASVQPTAASQNSVTDVASYFEPMLTGCQPFNIDAMVKQQPQAVADYKVKGDPNLEGAEVTRTAHFKNAVFFGYPISKIEMKRGFEQGRIKLYFNTDEFIKLRPIFQPPTTYNKNLTFSKNDAEGYRYGDDNYRLILEFNKKERSILCSY